jgi:peptidoglycan/xylan/chitin deacetylase (PgdA/CDA1 family)
MAQRLAVLMYHNVGPRPAGTNRWLTISAERFRAHIEWLARHGYSGITARQWLEHLRNNAVLPPKLVMLTFDDGYRGIADYAFPVLKEFGFPGVVFVVTARIGQTACWAGSSSPSAIPLLGADVLRRWSDEGIEFGSHSRTHRDLRSLAPASLHDELAGSRADLEGVLGREVCAFAYPYGFSNETVRAAAAGVFPLCFTTLPGTNDRQTQPHLLRRARVLPYDTALDVRFRASRGWSPLLGGALWLASDLRNRLMRRPPYDGSGSAAV